MSSSREKVIIVGDLLSAADSLWRLSAPDLEQLKTTLRRERAPAPMKRIAAAAIATASSQIRPKPTRARE